VQHEPCWRDPGHGEIEYNKIDVGPAQEIERGSAAAHFQDHLLATVATLAFASPSFAAEPETTVGQAPQSFYLAQDTATMKCEVVETQPVAGGKMRIVGAAHSTKAAAETALKADKTCVK